MAQQVKNLPARQKTQETEFDPWVGRIPWKRKWHPLQYSCLKNGQRSLMGYSPWGYKESDMTERLSMQAMGLLVG